MRAPSATSSIPAARTPRAPSAPALQACASNGYYYQATSSSQIATGFLQLTNQFLEHSTYISQ